MNNTLTQVIQQVPADDAGARDALFSAFTQVDGAHQARRLASRSRSPQPREETDTLLTRSKHRPEHTCWQRCHPLVTPPFQAHTDFNEPPVPPLFSSPSSLPPRFPHPLRKESS